MNKLRSSKNGLPIRRGVMLCAGPDNPVDPSWVVYYVVKVHEGSRVDLLDVNNNIMTFNKDEIATFWVVTSRLKQEEWYRDVFPYGSTGPAEDSECYISEICAGIHDRRFT